MKLTITRQGADGIFGITGEDGQFRPFSFHGNPIAQNGPWWFLNGVYDLGIGLFAVEWRDRDGCIALHYCDCDLCFVTSDYEKLSDLR